MKRFFEKREDWSNYKSFQNNIENHPMFFLMLGDTVHVHWLWLENKSKYRIFGHECGTTIKIKTHEEMLTGIFIKQTVSNVYLLCRKKLIAIEMYHGNTKVHYSEARTVLFEKTRIIHKQRTIKGLELDMVDEVYTTGGRLVFDQWNILDF